MVHGAQSMSVDQLLTVNISPRTVEAPHFAADSLLVVLARYGIDPDRVVVELTEREKVEDSARLQANLVALQRAGIRIAADDVGAGNADGRWQGYLLGRPTADTSLTLVDLAVIEAGGQVLERRQQPASEPLAAPTV